MTILLVSGTPHLPQVVGGLEVNTHELAIELNRRGRKVAVLSRLSPRDFFGASRLLRNALTSSDVAVDTSLGYPVYRTPKPWTKLRGLPQVQAAVVQNGNMVEIGRRFREGGVPTIAYFHGLPFEKAIDVWKHDRGMLPFASYIANSQFTAERFRNSTGFDASVIPPLFRGARYLSQKPSERRYVSFINPVPQKGVEVALGVAACCPEIPFRFIRAWPLPMRQMMRLRVRLRAVPNVSLVGPFSDMSEVYAATRVLLVPSQWCEETWGRVASEAQFSGIPVVGSDHGGLPEAIGLGGTLLKHNAEIGLWAQEVRRLYTDDTYWARKSEAALAHAGRPDITIERQIEAFLHVVDQAAA